MTRRYFLTKVNAVLFYRQYVLCLLEVKMRAKR